MYKYPPFENSKHSYRIQEVEQWAPFQLMRDSLQLWISFILCTILQKLAVGQSIAKF